MPYWATTPLGTTSELRVPMCLPCVQAHSARRRPRDVRLLACAVIGFVAGVIAAFAPLPLLAVWLLVAPPVAWGCWRMLERAVPDLPLCEEVDCDELFYTLTVASEDSARSLAELNGGEAVEAPRRLRAELFGASATGVLGVVMGGGVGYALLTSSLYVDNVNEVPIVVSVDGKKTVALPPGPESHVRLRLRRGEHTLTYTAEGEPGGVMTYAHETTALYVPGGKGCHLVLEVPYAVRGRDDKREMKWRILPDRELHENLANVDVLFEELPDEVEMRANESVWRSQLVRHGACTIMRRHDCPESVVSEAVQCLLEAKDEKAQEDCGKRVREGCAKL